MRTETYGCNQVPQWDVTPGEIDFVVQVLESSFQIEPLSVTFEVAEGECVDFLLRQRDGYELELRSLGPCQ